MDQDSYPELSNRYEDFGWPATIVFSPEGNEIVKRRGYIPPDRMANLLDAIIKDPTPGPSVVAQTDVKPSGSAFLNEDQRKYLEDMHLALYDKENGGWGKGNRLIFSDEMEFALVKAQSGDKKRESIARQTLDLALNLLDPVWGGFYQYSESKDWKGPHFEKIISIQTQHMRLYALASEYLKKPEYLSAAEKTADYLKNFLTSPDGAFYTSQDADVSVEFDGHKFYPLSDADRRKVEMPRIDQHIYARENGWAISALTTLYSVTSDEKYLKQAEHAAQWIIEHRSLPGGGFRHDEKDLAGPFLGDTLYMAQAFLNLYEISGNRAWLAVAVGAARFIDKNFTDKQGGGFKTILTAGKTGVFQKAVKQLDENIAIARFAMRLFYYTGNKKFKEMAEHAMKYATSPDIIKNRPFISGILLADYELSAEPVHVTVVGKKEDPKAKDLFHSALRYPANFRRVEWWDKKEGDLPNADVSYPELPKAAAFACAGTTCSFPVFEPEKIADQVNRARNSAV